MVSLLDVYVLVALTIIIAVNLKRGEFERRIWSFVLGVLGAVYFIMALKSFPLAAGLLEPPIRSWAGAGIAEVVLRIGLLGATIGGTVALFRQKNRLRGLGLMIGVLMLLGFAPGFVLRPFYTDGLATITNAAPEQIIDWELAHESYTLEALAVRRENRLRHVEAGSIVICRLIAEPVPFEYRVLSNTPAYPGEQVQQLRGTFYCPSQHSTNDYHAWAGTDKTFLLPPARVPEFRGDVPTSINYIGISCYAPRPITEDVMAFYVRKTGDLYIGYNTRAYRLGMFPRDPPHVFGRRIFQITIVPPGAA